MHTPASNQIVRIIVSSYCYAVGSANMVHNFSTPLHSHTVFASWESAELSFKVGAKNTVPSGN